MKDRPAAKTPRDDRHGRNKDDERNCTWYEESARHPVDEPLIATIPLPDGQ
jgi:hypothetical protein